jgi:hypothetical protein
MVGLSREAARLPLIEMNVIEHDGNQLSISYALERVLHPNNGDCSNASMVFIRLSILP